MLVVVVGNCLFEFSLLTFSTRQWFSLFSYFSFRFDLFDEISFATACRWSILNRHGGRYLIYNFFSLQILISNDNSSSINPRLRELNSYTLPTRENAHEIHSQHNFADDSGIRLTCFNCIIIIFLLSLSLSTVHTIIYFIWRWTTKHTPAMIIFHVRILRQTTHSPQHWRNGSILVAFKGHSLELFSLSV